MSHGKIVLTNIDLETRQHVIEVLQQYPGAMLLISHDSDFLAVLKITATYEIADGSLKLCKN